MNRLRIYGWAATGLALTASGWLLPGVPGMLANVSADMLSRSAGLALLGIVLVSAGLVFRAAMRAEQKPASATIRPGVSEYRRGFGGRVGRANAQPQRGVVVALRRVVDEQAKRPAPIEASTTLMTAAEIDRLQDMPYDGTAQTVAHNATMAKRPFLRSGVDQHGLAPQ